MNYKSIKQKVNDVFCIPNLREIYDSDKYEFNLSFIDFMMCIEDYYTFVYSTKLSKNAWLIFCWIRTLVRYDGFVKLSYKDVSNKFCDNNRTVISKPTFFKCIDELDSFGLVKKISNKKLFDNQYQKDINTYIVISKLDEIMPLMEGVSNQGEFYNILRDKYFNADLKIKDNSKSKVVQNQKNNVEYTYEYVVDEEYPEVKNEILDFFTFLGSANKSKKIAKSRQLKILNKIMEYHPADSDLVYAIGQTISKGVKSEKYLFAILKNLYEEPEEIIEDSTTKELKDKYKQKTTNTTNKDNTKHLTQQEFENAKQKVLTKEKGYLEIMVLLRDKIKNLNTKEQKLYDVCKRIDKKFKIHKVTESYRGERIGILCGMGINEFMTYDKYFNEIIYWAYDDNTLVPLKVMKNIAKKNPHAFTFSCVQFLDERMK